MVGEKIVTPSANFDPAIYWCIEQSESGIISPEIVVSRIESLFESNEFHLMAEDFEHTSSTNNQPKWNRNVRNRLLRLKKDGLLAHIGHNQYCNPRPLEDKFRIDPNTAWKNCAEIALFHKENSLSLISNDNFNIFIRNVSAESISLTKTTKDYHQLPTMEHYNGQVSTFLLNPPWIEKAIIAINTAGGYGHWKTINGNKKYIALSIIELHPQLFLDGDEVRSTEEVDGIDTVLDSFIPEDVVDNRDKVVKLEHGRIGQDKFRDDLMKVYNEKCPITGVSVSSVLQAAHICPYIGLASNHIQNGILLRSDFHLLFDNYQITIDASSYTIIIAPELKETEYFHYNNRQISYSSDSRLRPSKSALRLHNSKYLEKMTE